MMLINGKLVSGESGIFIVTNPATELPASDSVPHASESQLNAAVDAASVAFKSWSITTLDARQKYLDSAKNVLLSHVDELCTILHEEQGKSKHEAKYEMDMAIGFFDEISKVEIPIQTVSTTSTHSLQLHRKPIGVVAGIVPWNFPVLIAVMKFAVALVYGNTIVLKPSPNTPLTTLRIGLLLASVFPPGVLNIISGSDGVTPLLGDLLTQHPKVALTSFTGSILTGKRVFSNSASKLGRMVLELGGNDPAIVLGDANVDSAAKGVLEGGLINCGQICCGIKRVYVHDSIYQQFLDCIVKLASAKTGLAPLNNRGQRDRVAALVEDARSCGAQILTGGSQSSPGFFYPATIVTNIKEGVRLVDEEQFGPVLPIMKYHTIDEVVERANNTVFGLGASVWGTDPTLVNSVAQRLEAGIVWTNEHAADIPGLPFGGMKWSGVGREGGDFDLHTYTEPQSLKLMISK